MKIPRWNPEEREPVTISEWIRWGHRKIRHLDPQGQESRALMTALLGTPTASWTRGEDSLPVDQAEIFREWVERRNRREPFHLIVGEVPFYGRSFYVAPGVLIPRPETEHLVALAIDHLSREPRSGEPVRILDLGSGTGIIALTLLMELPELSGVAVEKDPRALRSLLENRRRFSLEGRLAVIQGHWGTMLDDRPIFDCILSNPPYIPTPAIRELDPEIRDYEPHLALDGGPDGLGCYREILSEAPALLKGGGLLAVEIGADQADSFRRSGAEWMRPMKNDQERWTAWPTVLQDVSGHNRIVYWKKEGA